MYRVHQGRVYELFKRQQSGVLLVLFFFLGIERDRGARTRASKALDGGCIESYGAVQVAGGSTLVLMFYYGITYTRV